jgi:hypothetical protein
MKPWRLQYFMAGHLGAVAGGIGALLGAFLAIFAISDIAPEPALYFGSATASGGFLLAVMSALAIGFIIGFMVFGRIFFIIFSRLNGAPFREGEMVRILTGPHRDCLTRIYAVWDERGSVRAEIDDQAKKDVKDVFTYHQICREK